jgi:hypothetical protein
MTKKKPKGHHHDLLKAASALPPGLHFAVAPTPQAMQAALAAASSNPCEGAAAGKPCMVLPGPNGTLTICRCDGNGNCVC